MVEVEIKATLPKQPRDPMKKPAVRRKIFECIRRLKAIDGARDMDDVRLCAVAHVWHEQAVLVAGPMDLNETLARFTFAWPRAKRPFGYDDIDEVFEQAKKTDPPQRAVELYGVHNTRILDLVRLCRQLQQRAGKGPFRLDCGTAARLLKVSRKTAWMYLGMLKGHNMLRLHGERGRRGRASRYDYVLPDGKPVAAKNDLDW
jgi:hypothetical protein